jgi:hypothetical protein
MVGEMNMKADDHPLYKTFTGMRDRCRNPKHQYYHRYGGRGISVCPQWLERGSGFWNWLEHMGPRPEGHSIDRIDNDGNYEPGNVRWATRSQQYYNSDIAKGERHGQSKLTREKVSLIKKALAEGLSAKAVGAMFGVPRTTVSDIKHGRTWVDA